VSLPYDVLTEEERDDLYQTSPFNIVRLIWGKELPGREEEGNPYLRASALLQSWLKEGILRRDEEEAFYLSVQDFSFQGRGERRTGLVARVSLSHAEGGSIFLHEETFSQQVNDRLQLLQATSAHLDSIFAVYAGDSEALNRLMREQMEDPPLLDLQDRWGVRNRIWAVHGKERLETISEEMRGRQLIVADGHHRYQASLRYFAEKGQQGHVLMTLVSLNDPGLVILPYHRLILDPEMDTVGTFLNRLRSSFRVDEVRLPHRKERQILLTEYLWADTGPIPRFAFYGGGDSLFLLTRPSRGISDASPLMEIFVLEEEILPNLKGWEAGRKEEMVCYTPSIEEALHQVEAGGAQLAIFLRPPSPQELLTLVRGGRKAPPKSTYFYPKLLSGLVLDLLDG